MGGCARIVLLVTAMLAAVSSPVRAQGLRFTRIGGNVEVGGDIRQQRFESPAAEERRFDRERIDERITVDAEGYAFRPGLLKFGVGLTGGFRQGWRDSSEGDLGNDDGRLLDFDADLQLFRDSQLSFLLYGRRVDNDTNQSVGTDTESSGSTLGSVAQWNTPLFPSTFTWQRQLAKTESFGGSLATKRDESRRLLEYSGQRVTEDGQIRLRLLEDDVDDQSVPSVGDYRIREGSALVARRFGPYREKSWQTSGRYFERDGRFDFSSASADTLLGWQVTEDFDLSAQHQFARFEATAADTTTNDATFSMGYKLYESLHSKLRFFGHDIDQDDGGQQGYGGDLSLGYKKNLPWQTLLRIDTRVRYERQNNDLASRVVPVIGESLILEGLTSNFLENRLVDPDSVQVFDGANGPLLVEGTDYIVDSFGDRLSIDPLLGGQVGIGSQVVVNYQFAADPSSKLDTTNYRIGIGLEREWLRFRYEHDATSEDHRSGRTTALAQDSERDSFHISARKQIAKTQASASAQYVIDRNVSVSFTEWELTQSLQWSPISDVDLSLNLREGAREFTRPNRDTDHIDVAGWITWRPWRTARLRIYAEHRRFNDSLSPDQRIVEVGLKGRFQYARIEILPSFDWKESTRGMSTLQDISGALRIRRSF